MNNKTAFGFNKDCFDAVWNKLGEIFYDRFPTLSFNKTVSNDGKKILVKLPSDIDDDIAELINAEIRGYAWDSMSVSGFEEFPLSVAYETVVSMEIIDGQIQSKFYDDNGNIHPFTEFFNKAKTNKKGKSKLRRVNLSDDIRS